MRKVNTKDVPEELLSSPKGKYECGSVEISVALGRVPNSTDLRERHPFDVEIQRVPPGRRNYPFHSHSSQWEFYHVISGRGSVRHDDGSTPIEAGDAFVFEPGKPHQLVNDGPEDLVVYVIADNPIGSTSHYPDSNKWAVGPPEHRTLVRSEPLDYFDGEE
ncbi:MAG TPA: cupin domain-containing protein [Candidatus Acidoferrales bacterium]|nr:cupin domain-containing protein [Candidatus Acidoferrales bacterium]